MPTRGDPSDDSHRLGLSHFQVHLTADRRRLGSCVVAGIRAGLVECRDRAKILTERGVYPEAETMLLASFEIFNQIHGLDHPDIREAIDAFMALYTAWGKPEEAARYRAMRTEEAP